MRRAPTHRPTRPKRVVSPLWPFYIQASFITWFAWLPGLVLGPRNGYELFTGVDFYRVFRGPYVNANHIMVVVLFWLAVYGPFLSALGITQRSSGDAGIRALLGRMVRWRLPWRWYATIVALAAISLLPALIVARLTGVAPAQPSLPLPTSLILPFFLYQLLTSGMEEPGWRGFLLPYLQRRYTAEQASYMVGGLWALWRLPYVISLYPGPALPFALVGFALNLIGSSVIYTWLYNNTGSLFLTIIYHALTSTMMALAVGWIGAHPAPQLIVGLTSWAIAWALLRVYGPERLSQR